MTQAMYTKTLLHSYVAIGKLHTSSQRRQRNQSIYLKVFQLESASNFFNRKSDTVGPPKILNRAYRHANQVVSMLESKTQLSDESALLWFKHDLRLDDHPGLVNSKKSKMLANVFVFDPSLLKCFPEDLLLLLLEAVAELRSSLKALGSDLIVRTGNAADIIPALAEELSVSSIFTEAEVEDSWKRLVGGVSAALELRKLPGNLSLTFWNAPLHDMKGTDTFYEDFNEFKKKKGSTLLPLDVPPSLPPKAAHIEAGAIPSLADLLALKKGGSKEGSVSSSSAASSFSFTSSSSSATLSPWSQDLQDVAPFLQKGGAKNALDFFRGYLRFFEPTSRGDWQEFYFSLLKAATADPRYPIPPFPLLFHPCLTLGTLSLRRVVQEAMEYERQRGGGRISPLGFSTPSAKSAVEEAEAWEFHGQLARKEVEGGEGRHGCEVRFWRWRGMLVEYATAGSAGPAVVLVHGFGAFWDHFRSSVLPLADAGHRVWALTLPGFGRSQKPKVGYSQHVWSECVRDFIQNVVREEEGERGVVLAGNSIGGYTAASVAADWPHFVSHLVLLNSAGRIVEDYKAAAQGKVERVKTNGPPKAVAWLFSRLLFLYLQSNVQRILRRCYPTVPSRADEFLVQEIIRASRDPGAVDVVESAFYLPTPRPLNFLLKQFGGPVLVVQGKHDPLNDAVARALLLKQSYADVAVEFVEAGHCPHDELPNVVNGLIDKFAKAAWATQNVLESKVSPSAGLQPSGVLDILEEEVVVSLDQRP